MDFVKWWYAGNKQYEELHKRIAARGWIECGHIEISLRPGWRCKECNKQNIFTVWTHKDGRVWCNDCVVKDSKKEPALAQVR